MVENYPFYFGGVASACAACMTHPLDLVKVRLQTNASVARSSLVQTSVDIVRKESIFALFNGLSASLLRQLSYSTVRFGFYDYLKYQYVTRISPNEQRVPFSVSVLMGLCSGAFAGVAGNPADVVNVRMQNDGKLPVSERRNYRHAVDGLMKIYRQEGFAVLYRGVNANVNRSMVLTASQLVSYDQFKRMIIAASPSYFTSDALITHFSSSFLAGLVATTFSSPLDVVKTRFMSNKGNSGSVASAIVSIVKQEGFLGLYKGWVPSFTRLGPQTVLTFMILERLKALYISYKQQ